ncbi:MAG TPA: tRNA epoxyqueuosine(34) reductase QueG [Candidatus Polarisedimenticolia bacterium]|jgi:epoxyqueuosine reductase|nr:tRNA epoxyqueuosine(34) reductase QueG [Candidatus Polarisedimenticolia bacterium]
MNAEALADRLRARANEIGLGVIGFAALGRAATADALAAWLERGHAGAMRWMDRTAEDRADPTRRFPWAKSVVVAAVPHLPYTGARAEQEGLLPYVARYAAGADYHRVILARLETLQAFLHREAPGATSRAYVDTGPLLEREWAVRAGLGWFGKSTNLIRPHGPSWVLLGEILTSVELPVSSQVPDRCGTCTACLDACPTGAILEPYVVDSRRCISYLTLELRGRLPAGNDDPSTEDWIFGCDICQEVCPWNRKAAPADDPPFRPASALAATRLADLVRLDEPSFRERFAGTALLRPGRRELLRNAFFAAAHAGDNEALAGAAAARGDPDPVVREAAAEALRRARHPSLREARGMRV